MDGDPLADLRAIFEDRFPHRSRSVWLVALIKHYEELWNDHAVVPQVCGYLIMQHGFRMTTDLYTLIIEGIDRDQSDDWLNTEARCDALAVFRKNIDNYFTNVLPNRI